MFIGKNTNSVNASVCPIQSTNRFNKIPIIIAAYFFKEHNKPSPEFSQEKMSKKYLSSFETEEQRLMTSPVRYGTIELKNHRIIKNHRIKKHFSASSGATQKKIEFI